MARKEIMIDSSCVGRLVSDVRNPKISADFLVDVIGPTTIYLRPMNKKAQEQYQIDRGIVCFDRKGVWYEIQEEEAIKLGYK